MKRKWLAVSLVGLSLFTLHGTVYATVLDRPTLFLELMQQNEQLSRTAVMLMTQYLENPSSKDLAELKCLFRKMMGDNERNYLASNGFTVDDFIGGLDAIAQMPVQDRQQLLSELNQKAYKNAHELLMHYDSAVIVGQEVIPLADGSGKVKAPTNAKADFEKMLKSAYEKSNGLNVKAHWTSNHVQWLTEEKGFDQAHLLDQDPNEVISSRELLELLTDGFNLSTSLQDDSLMTAKDEPISRIDAMRLLYDAMQLNNTAVPKSMSGQFTDMQMLSENQQTCVLALVSNQIVKGYTDGTLKPNQALSFGEAWAMIRLALD